MILRIFWYWTSYHRTLRPAAIPGIGMSSERSRELDDANDALIEHLSKIVTVNTRTISTLGARAMVLGKFLDAVLPRLTTVQRAETAKSFRHGIEETMSLMDEVLVPVEYHSELLELTNTILANLGHGSSKCRQD